MDYPKQLYRSGWDDLTDTIVVQGADEEGDSRAAGFRMLSEPPDDPVDIGEPEAPKRRGRPPKAAE